MARTVVYAHPSTQGGSLQKVYLSDVIPEEVLIVVREYRAGRLVAVGEALEVLSARLEQEGVPC